MTKDQIKENIELVKNKIFEAEKKSGREAGSVRLCAVSKFHPMEDVLAAVDAGQKLFGENRVQEAYSKFNEIYSEDVQKSIQIKPELHIIGSLQSNKVKKACEIASCIQSVDRAEILAEIEKQCAKLDKKMNVFFELHTGEDSKCGFETEDLLLKSAEDCAGGKYPHVCPVGLMTMAPFTDDESLIRASFIKLRNLREKLNAEFPSLAINELSMGMSGDFQIAIEEGSSIVRVGTAIFGERDYSK